MTAARKFIIQRDSEGSYVATFPESPDYQTQADSLKALMERLRDAMAHRPGEGKPPKTPRPAVRTSE